MINTRLNLKTRFVRERKKNAIISKMSLYSVLRRTSSYLCPADNLPRALTSFSFMIFTQERNSTYVDPRPYNLQL